MQIPDTRRSTSSYYVYLGDNLISWSAKREHTLSRSSTEAEYHGVANVVSESCWIRNLLLELHSPVTTATLVYCDNVSVVYLSATQSNFNAPNTSRWIYILCMRKSPVAKYDYYMSLHVTKSLTSSPKDFRCNSLMIFVIVSTFVNLPFQLRGCTRISLSLLEYFCYY